MIRFDVMHRKLAWLFCVLFLLAAAVQINDPDPAGWIAVYLAAAITSGLAGANRRWAKYPSAVLALVSLCWASFLAYVLVSEGHALLDEVGRESMGLGVVAVWSMGIVFYSRKQE